MKGLFLFSLIFIPFGLIAQSNPDSIIVFTGYILDEDSIPIQNACLINYRTLRISATDSTGHFRTKIMKGDSLMINHIAYGRKLVHGNNKNASSNTIILPFQPYMIKEVIVSDYSRDLANFEKNISRIYADLKKIGPPVDYKQGRSPHTINRYAPGAQAIGFGIDLSALFRRRKR